MIAPYMSDSDSEEEEVKRLGYLAKSTVTGSEKVFGPEENDLEEAKEWLHKDFIESRCKDEDKQTDWFIQVLVKDHEPEWVYRHDLDDFYSGPQLEFARFVCQEGYIEDEQKIEFLELLRGCRFQIRYGNIPPTKKQKKRNRN